MRPHRLGDLFQAVAPKVDGKGLFRETAKLVLPAFVQDEIVQPITIASALMRIKLKVISRFLSTRTTFDLLDREDEGTVVY